MTSMFYPAIRKNANTLKEVLQATTTEENTISLLMEMRADPADIGEEQKLVSRDIKA